MRLQWSSPDLYWHNQAISQAMGLPQLQYVETTFPFVKTPDPLPCTAKLRPKVLRLGTKVNLHTSLHLGWSW